MGTCACVETPQKDITSSYIDISSNITNLHFKDSSNTTNMLEPRLKAPPLQKESSKVPSSTPPTNQSTSPSSLNHSISHIKPSSFHEYKNYSNSNPHEINITLIGNSHTGKSTFVIKYVDKFFEKHYIPTIGIEHYVKKVNASNEECIINFQVAPGDNEYVFDYKNVLQRNDFIFLFYDVSLNGSFKQCVTILKSKIACYEKTYCGNVKNAIFVGSKVDILPRKEPLSKIQVFCLENNYKFFEISAKHTIGFKELMKTVISMHCELLVNNV